MESAPRFPAVHPSRFNHSLFQLDQPDRLCALQVGQGHPAKRVNDAGGGSSAVALRAEPRRFRKAPAPSHSRFVRDTSRDRPHMLHRQRRLWRRAAHPKCRWPALNRWKAPTSFRSCEKRRRPSPPPLPGPHSGSGIKNELVKFVKNIVVVPEPSSSGRRRAFRPGKSPPDWSPSGASGYRPTDTLAHHRHLPWASTYLAPCSCRRSSASGLAPGPDPIRRGSRSRGRSPAYWRSSPPGGREAPS